MMSIKLYEVLDEKGVAMRDEMGRFDVLRPKQFITDKMIEKESFNQNSLDHMVSTGRIKPVKDLGVADVKTAETKQEKKERRGYPRSE